MLTWLSHQGIARDDTQAICQLLESELREWHPLFLQPVSATKSFTFLPMRQLHVPWSRQAKNRTALIGDAAHVMPPYAGAGANIALVDALELAVALSGDVGDDIADRLVSIEQNMFDRAYQAQELTRRRELAVLSDKSFAEIFS